MAPIGNIFVLKVRGTLIKRGILGAWPPMEICQRWGAVVVGFRGCAVESGCRFQNGWTLFEREIFRPAVCDA